MDILLMALLLADLYLIIYYRMTIGYWRAKVTGQEESGFLVAVSLPSRKELPAEARKYYWRYWGAVVLLIVILSAGTAYRLPVIREAIRGMS